MSRILIILAWLLTAILTVSCFKEDDKVAPHLPGNTLIDTIALTSLYKYQDYYDLGTGASVMSNLKNKWDISFESTPGGWHIRLNASCFMYAAALKSQDFGIMADTSGAGWKFDNSNGNIDSTAIGTWFLVNGIDTVSNGNLLVINRGMDELGNERGCKQLIIDSLAQQVYYFRLANFDGTHQQSFSIQKDPHFNNILFSFDSGMSVVDEPGRDTWDLLFSQYTTLLYTDIGEPYPYLVTGVLLNPNLVEVARDSVHSFDAITYESASGLNFSRQQDFIGYDWKYYDFDTGSYTIRVGRVYIIRDVAGFCYKLRFLGFYNDKGEKGFPSIEYQQL